MTAIERGHRTVTIGHELPPGRTDNRRDEGLAFCSVPTYGVNKLIAPDWLQLQFAHWKGLPARVSAPGKRELKLVKRVLNGKMAQSRQNSASALEIP